MDDTDEFHTGSSEMEAESSPEPDLEPVMPTEHSIPAAAADVGQKNIPFAPDVSGEEEDWEDEKEKKMWEEEEKMWHKVERTDLEHSCPIHDCVMTCCFSPKQDEGMESRLVNPIITFTEQTEGIGKVSVSHSKRLPPFFYRTTHENSATLCSRMSEHNYSRHRENEALKLRTGNSFQAMGKVRPKRDLTRMRIERHLIWGQKRDLSSWILVFNALRPALKRASFHSEESQKVAHRVSIAKIRTAGLVAATMSADCVTRRYIKVPDGLGRKTTKFTITKRGVNMPIYVNEKTIPADKSPISLSKLIQAPGSEIWVSMAQLSSSDVLFQPIRHGRVRMITTPGQDYEWLALGHIDESRIEYMMPYDGEFLHCRRGADTVWSKRSQDDWVWDWDLNKGTWVQDKALFALAKEKYEKKKAEKEMAEKEKAEKEKAEKEKAEKDTYWIFEERTNSWYATKRKQTADHQSQPKKKRTLPTKAPNRLPESTTEGDIQDHSSSLRSPPPGSGLSIESVEVD